MKHDPEYSKEFLQLLIGQPDAGSHPDEWGPRADSWHSERRNWIKEVDSLRAENERLRGELNQQGKV